jgi:hypothetical protein
MGDQCEVTEMRTILLRRKKGEKLTDVPAHASGLKQEILAADPDWPPGHGQSHAPVGTGSAFSCQDLRL